MADDGHNRTPRPLECTNIATEWPKWKQQFVVWMIANGKMAKPEKEKIAIFIWLLGEQGVAIYNTLYPNDGSELSMLGVNIPAATEANPNAVRQRKLDEVIKAFEEYCVPRKNVAMEAYKFNMITQKEKQSFAEFETELRKQIQYCEYSCSCGIKYDDRMLRDRIIVGVHDKKLQLKLLDGRDETLAKVIDTCKVFEAANQHKQMLEAKQVVATIATEDEVNVINQPKRFCFNCGQQWDVQHKLVCKAKELTCRNCAKRAILRACVDKEGRVHNRKVSTTIRADQPLTACHGVICQVK